MSRKVDKSIKRALDVTLACATLLLTAPLFVVVYLSLLVRLGRPVIFSQQRPGYKGHPFDVYKFRTMMKATRRKNGRSMTDDERIGRLGKLIRKFSLDELPQLWNVLRGDMSLIGPRPLLMEYLDLYTPEQMRRHDVRPGITGLAQVSGRNNLPWEERFDLDVWYVDHWSLWLDMKILLLTAKNVFKGEGVSARGVVSMTKFTGSSETTT